MILEIAAVHCLHHRSCCQQLGSPELAGSLSPIVPLEGIEVLLSYLELMLVEVLSANKSFISNRHQQLQIQATYTPNGSEISSWIMGYW